MIDSKVAHKSKKKSRTQALTESLLRDRAERAARKAVRSSTKIERGDFDPFSVTRWRVIAGADPGHLVKTPMRMGKVGWLIQCRACAVEFESKGWMALPAEERRDHEPVKRVGRPCARPGCVERLSKRARADARYCSAACRKTVSRDKSGSGLPYVPAPEMSQLEAQETQQNQGSDLVLIGPGDFPVNVIGGYKFPLAPPCPDGVP
jgi:hypothetical protein